MAGARDREHGASMHTRTLVLVFWATVIAACDGNISDADSGMQRDDGGTQRDDGGTRRDDGGTQRDDGGMLSDASDVRQDAGGDDAGTSRDGGGTPTDAGSFTGAIVRADSCSAADVQAALEAAPGGARVEIPAGECDWGSASVTHRGSVWLRGDPDGGTTLRRSANTDSDMITLLCSTDADRVRFSHLNLEGSFDTRRGEDNGLRIGTSARGCLDFRVHDSVFRGFAASGVEVNGRARGVIYQNRFERNFRPGLGYGVVVYGDDTWGELDWGSRAAVFVEDNDFYFQRHHIAANRGARYVFRYNRVRGAAAAEDWTMVDAHGRAEGAHGTRALEVYRNLFEVDDDVDSADSIGLRGGDALVFDNAFSPRIAYTVRVTMEIDGCPSDTTEPFEDQTTVLHVWNNTLLEGATETVWGVGPNYVDNDCPRSFREGEHIHFAAPSGYTPFTYPHPLRSEP